jgi:alpha-tubulin suppressor-like RCC1 family protein
VSDTNSRSAATQVPGLANVTAIVAGGAHSFALRSDGAIFGWGFNAQGQLGLGSVTTAVCLPARVAALDGRVDARRLLVAVSLARDRVEVIVP